MLPATNRLTRAIALVAVALSTWLSTSSAAPNCKKGIPCGNSCIAADRVCHTKTPAQQDRQPGLEQQARVSGAAGSHHSTHTGAHHEPKAAGVPRNSKGRIERSRAARADFQRTHPCPSTGKSSGACPGYVVDHVQPLKRGGADAPSNMQWQTTQEAKIKDRTE